MTRFSRLSIYYKFNTIILGILILILVMGTVLIRSSSRQVEDQLEKRGVELATYIGALSTNDIILDDRYALLDRINRTKNHSDDVRYIIVADSRGKILAHSFSDKFPQGLPALISWPKTALPDGGQAATGYRVDRYDSSEGPIREIVLPVEDGNIGFIRVGLSDRATEQIIDRGKKNFMVTLLVLCLVAAMGSIYLAFVFVRPLRALTGAADQIRRGNFRVEAGSGGTDEVGRLSGVFNEMARSLDDKQQENTRLLEELRGKEEIRAQLLKKLFVVQEDERKRLSRELHDETGQLLASLLAYMKLLDSKLTTTEQQELLLKARELTNDVLGGLRRTAVELRPTALDDLGLATAMGRYIENFGKVHGIRVRMKLPEGRSEVGGEISLALYRILQESLTNIAKHARASSVEVMLEETEDCVRLEIRDDGVGIDEKQLTDERKNRLGLYGMMERAELLGGTLVLDSSPEWGTAVTITLPKILG